MKLPLQILSLSLLLTGAAHAQGGPITTERLTITGPGSTGPIDGMTVGGRPLSDLAASTVSMPPPSGNAATDAAAFAAAQATGKQRIVFQAGTYLVPAAGYAPLRSGQNVEGQGRNRTILRATARVIGPAGMLYGLEKSDIDVRGLTLDYAGFPAPADGAGVLTFRNAERVRIENVEVLGFPRFGFVLNGGTDVRLERVRIERAATPLDTDGATMALGRQNQCVLVSESANPVKQVAFVEVICQGSGFDVSGADIDYVRTDVQGFSFGAAYTVEQGTNSVRHRLLDVKASGGRTDPTDGLDENQTSAVCIELWSPDSVIDGAECSDMGGGGVALGGKRTRLSNSRFRGLGKQVPSEGIGIRYEANGLYSADGSVIANNVVVDTNGSGDGSNLRLPFAEQSLTENMRVRLIGNDFGSKPLSRKGANAAWSAPGMLISAASPAYTHYAGTLQGPTGVTIPGARRTTDTITNVQFVGSAGQSLPTGLRPFAEIATDNVIYFFVQDISGGSSPISVPAGTFTGRIVAQ